MSTVTRPDRVVIGNGAGFLGDWTDAPRRLAEGARLDYLTLEYLAELTMSILARSREKDPARGYAEDLIAVLASLVPALSSQPKLRIITNAGGVNPVACAAAAAEVLVRGGLSHTPIAVVTGDDLQPRLRELQAAGCRFENLDTGQPLANLTAPVISANAYFGAAPIVQALAAGARIVITGRVADASLTVAPAVHEFGCAWDDWPRLAGASVAGHLIECGAQVTGGYMTSDHWYETNLAEIGYPIAEFAADGSCIITKPDGSGGAVDRETVAAQLVYEIGDPAHYLTPDVDVNFTTVEIDAIGRDRVRVRGATGQPPPDTLKVSLAHHDGYTAAGELLVSGPRADEKARVCASIVVARMRSAGVVLDEMMHEVFGDAQSALVLRIAARDERREAVELFTKQFAPLITSGPAGLAGYARGRPQVRPVYAYWPTNVPRALVKPRCEVRTAAEWRAMR
jgi:hypothetical protein